MKRGKEEEDSSGASVVTCTCERHQEATGCVGRSGTAESGRAREEEGDGGRSMGAFNENA
jgi:hypothetical protein